MTRITIIGAAGRMGRALIRGAAESSNLALVGAVDSPTSSFMGRDAGQLAGIGDVGVHVCADLALALASADVAIDFSHAGATESNLTACVRARKPLLVGTTGFAPELETAFAAAAAQIPLLVAPNTSVGVTLLIELVKAAARALPRDFDIEVIESHHRMKRDAPSGTALALGRAASEGRNEPFDASVGESPAGTGHRAPRREGEIGFAVVRGGDIVGEHTVLFAGTGERLALSHQATDRAIFARGALQAAAWLAPRAAGRYFMHDFVAYKSGT
jgi:4-hydroxy-tetrahydrodipicolinate reductase